MDILLIIARMYISALFDLEAEITYLDVRK